MRTLKFIVDGQSIRPDPSCDFSNIVRGTKGYLQAEFQFSNEWKDLFKVAEFRRYSDGEVIPVAIVNNKCVIPDVTSGLFFRVSVVGKRGDIRLTTDEAEVRQK